MTKLVTSLLSWSEKKPDAVLLSHEISVISPFREQVWRIRKALRGINLRDVNVGTVEALQGAEKYVFGAYIALERSSTASFDTVE